MAPKQPCAKYQYVVTSAGPKILPVDEPSCKDEESPADYNAGGYLPIKLGDTFGSKGRYRVLRKLGWGHFSTVWLVKDSNLDRHSALKVVKSAGRYAETARDEIKLLSRVSSFSPTHPGRQHIVSFLDSFCHEGPEASHVCIVFEPLGENLLALIERNKKKGVPKALVKVIAKQVLMGLQYLHDECDLVHTDIKPENILISIPDIESHIHAELSVSPTPTSRRVGVPAPTSASTKARAPGGTAVAIPKSGDVGTERRSRKQVQIFDSQPLSSPGRSLARSPGILGKSGSMVMSHLGSRGNTGSNGNTASGSLQTQPAILNSSLARSGTSITEDLNGHRGGHSSTLTSTRPVAPTSFMSNATPKTHLNTSPTDLVSPPNATATSPSPSSSTSSVLSHQAPSLSMSISSTPPTSFVSSVGAASATSMELAPTLVEGNIVLVARGIGESNKYKGEVSIPMPIYKSNGHNMTLDMEPIISASWKVTSTSWQDKFSASWKEKMRLGVGLSSKKSSSAQGLRTNKNVSTSGSLNGNRKSHTRTESWKDPGVAAPAPAVVVSATITSTENTTLEASVSDDFFNLVTPTGMKSSTASSDGSSTTVRSTPISNVYPATKRRQSHDHASLAVSCGIKNVIDITHDSDSPFPDSVDVLPRTSTTVNPTPSLLTQTAPSRVPGPSARIPTDRPSPPQHISQLSAHIHRNPSSHIHHPHDRKPTPLRAENSITPTPVSPPSTVPPPTPSSPSSPTSPFILHSTKEMAVPITIGSLAPLVTPPIPPPLQTDSDVVSPPISIKIADLGNATPSTKHYTEDIQTRQYRAPEAILGKKDWTARVDIWSVACVVFELLTSEYLFDPHGEGQLFTKDDDHMAQIIELMGDFPLEVKMGGKYSREMFDSNGALRYIRTLKFWPLKRVMMEKYLYSEQDAADLCEFLEPMLAVDPRQRKDAKDMLDNRWLDPSENDGVVEDW